MTNQTNTTMFTCTATHGKTYKTRKFFSLNMNANKKAKAWLAKMDDTRKAA